MAISRDVADAIFGELPKALRDDRCSLKDFIAVEDHRLVFLALVPYSFTNAPKRGRNHHPIVDWQVNGQVPDERSRDYF